MSTTRCTTGIAIPAIIQTPITVSRFFRYPMIAFISLILATVSQPVKAEVIEDSIPKILQRAGNSGTPFLPDFSYAGYKFGVGTPAQTGGTIIRAVKYGVKAGDGKDDSKSLLKALKAAHDIKGPVTIQLPAGKIILSEILFLKRSNLVFKGAGSGDGGTTLYFPRPLKLVDKTSNLNELREYLVANDKRQREKNKNLDILFSEYSWSGGFIWTKLEGSRPSSYLKKYNKSTKTLASLRKGKRGEFLIEVSSTDNLHIGQVIAIEWRNSKGPNGPLIKAIYGETDLDVGSRHWEDPTRALVKQVTRIVDISSNQIRIASPLMHDISDELPAKAKIWRHLEEIGIEDIHFEFPMSPHFGHHVEQGYNAIYLTDVFNSWIKNVRITNSDSGVLSYNSANVTIKDIETVGDHAAHYSVHIGSVHNVLVENLKVRNSVQHSLSFNTQSSRSVYLNSEVFRSSVLDQHAGANHQNLFDNITMHIKPTEKKGELVYSVFDGSGAKYWQPGHGAFNTTWNLHLVVSGPMSDKPIVVQGLAEGPNARIIGLSGNREFKLDYRPTPYSEFLNKPVSKVPSLYEYQLGKRLKSSGRAGD